MAGDLGDIGTAFINVELDFKNAVREAQNAGKNLPPVEVEVSVDKSQATREVKQSLDTAEAAAGPIEAKIEVDSKKLSNDVRDALKDAQDKSGPVKPDLLINKKVWQRRIADAIVPPPIDGTGPGLKFGDGFGNGFISALSQQNIGGKIFSVIKPAAFVAGLGAAAQAVSVATAGVTSLVGALVPLQGALVAYPGVLGSFAQSFGVVKFALDGVTEALGGLNDTVDPKKLALLSKPAQEFVKFLDSAKPAIREFQKALQSILFPKFVEGLKIIAPTLASLEAPLLRTAQKIGGLVIEAAQAFKSLGASFELLIRFNNSLIKALGRTGLVLLNSFVTIMLAARPLIAFIVDGVLALANALNESLTKAAKDGSLAAYFNQTKFALQQIVRLIGSVGRIFGSVFSAATPTGNKLLEMLNAQAKALADFLDTPSGKQSLKKYFEDSMGSIIELGRLVRDVVSAFFELSRTKGLQDILKTVRTQLLPAFVSLIKITTSELLPVLIPAISNLILVFGDLSGTNDVITGLVGAIGDMAGAMHELFQNNPELLSFVSNLSSIMSIAGFGLIKAVATDILGLSEAVGVFLKRLGIIGFIFIQIKGVVDLVKLAFDDTRSAGDRLWSALQIFLLITPIFRLIGLAIKGVKWIIDNVGVSFKDVKNAILVGFNAIIDAVPGLKFILGGIKFVFDAIVTAFNFAKSAIISGFSAIINKIPGLKFVINNIGLVFDLVSVAFVGMKNTILTGISDIIDAIPGLRSAVNTIGDGLNAVRDTANGVFSSVKSTVGGAVDSVASKQNKIGDAALTNSAIVRGAFGSMSGSVASFGAKVDQHKGSFTSLFSSLTASIQKYSTQAKTNRTQFTNLFSTAQGLLTTAIQGAKKHALALAGAAGRVLRSIGTAVRNQLAKKAIDDARLAIVGLSASFRRFVPNANAFVANLQTVRINIVLLRVQMSLLGASFINMMRAMVIASTFMSVRFVNIFINAIGRIHRVLAGANLYASGQRIMMSFLAGLQAGFSQVKTFIRGIAAWIRQNKGPISADKKLLYPAGQAIMGGFDRGLHKRWSPIRQWVSDIGTYFKGAVSPNLFNSAISDILLGGGKGIKGLNGILGSELGIDPAMLANGPAGFLHPTSGWADTLSQGRLMERMFGLHMGSGLRTYDTVPGPNVSQHVLGQAIDWGTANNSFAKLDHLARFASSLHRVFRQVIWQNRDWSNGGFIGNHMDHVHTGWQARAAGGNTRQGEAYSWNERGREMFVPQQSGYVMNAGRTKELISAIKSIASSKSSPSANRNAEIHVHSNATDPEAVGSIVMSNLGAVFSRA